ncbi:DUF1173 domain-containing protein [Variovorax sp. YR216]|uniref:DUF1173 domain-containing protein n=1 Tax=Variovorax sp. YR216 TaxID=1882828 RepID=UPI00089ACF2D|nr:DUF1173 domain-containing protein [Variovorax sp. YR216]SEB26308.1 Protein of unknown function [Variovorax sp. YR216]
MSLYRINDVIVQGDDPGFAAELVTAYAGKVRPLCLCRNPGIEMYIAKIAGRLAIKRMPNTGRDHAPACDSYEPPPELSGIGQVMGSAIHEDPEKGLTALKFDFALAKSSGRPAPATGGSDASSVMTDGNRLTLRGTLHYLWEEAGFNRWSPTMAGKRNWYVIRKHLLQAASDKTAKGVSLADLLYIPESFNAERTHEIAQRRIKHTTKAAATEIASGPRPLMIVVGEVKELAPSRYGHKIVFKHLPDWHFMMNDDLHKRLRKRFETELGLWDAMPDTHLVAIGTFGVGHTGVASLEEVALMTVTEGWIPFESSYDKTVIDAMAGAHRRFSKALRYNLPANRPLASLVATDTSPQPTAMYVLPPGATGDDEAALDELMQSSHLARWLWRAGELEMPALPLDQHHPGHATEAPKVKGLQIPGGL